MAKTNQAKKPAASKEVATQKETGTAVAAYDYGDEGGAGFEDITSADLAIPFLGILQALSPAVADEEIAGAKSGMFCNTVTKELFDGEKGVGFIPCHTEHAYVEWIARKNGGGFVTKHETDSEFVATAQRKASDEKSKVVREGGKIILENGNELIETKYVYGLMLDLETDETTGFAVVSFTSTKLTPYKNWFTSMYTIKNSKKIPIYAHRAIFKTFKVKNDHGTFFNIKVEPYKGARWQDGLINPETEGALLAEALEFRTMILDGRAKADHSSEQATASPNSTGGSEEEIPF